MGQSAKIAVTLPEDMYRDIERLRQQTHVSRSALVQRALLLLLGQTQKQERIRAYVEGYRQNPETDDDVEAAKASAVELLSGVPWE